MRRSQLEHAICTACQVMELPSVIVVGSQAILGSYREEELPEAATMSLEVDVLADVEDPDEAAALADRVEGVAGELSTFGFTGFCLDPADLCAAKLCAHREKDLNFVGALLDAGLVGPEVLRSRLELISVEHAEIVARALSWLDLQLN